MNLDCFGDIALAIMGVTVVVAFVVLIACGLAMLVHDTMKELKKK